MYELEDDYADEWSLYLEETIGGNTDKDTEADKGADKGADKNADPDEYEDKDTELLLSKM
ncbi:hypothetical protein B0A50_06077 [Salinomyces thailandicus]|uniref:Uncharacterized protein n=1 Tax=Salinomyces thailandicus TaxID=706561 RepID=A0A4V5N3T9_9PEZI|nr:hypothetical protein B0A50_06077 [Salinomyces thailandica]